MKVRKSYNNNIVLSENDDGKEVILIGRGLAFGLHKGDEIDSDKIEKVFEMKLKGSEKNRYERIIESIPVEYVSVADEIITYIKENCSKHINDSIYITLTDHIASSIDRLKMGVEFDSALILNTKQLYREEYNLALKAVEILRERFDIKIDDSEANFITLHIVTAEMDSNMEQMFYIAQITDEILKIIRKYFRIKERDNYDFDRFMTHCRFFVQRVINNEKVEDNGLNGILKFNLMHNENNDQVKCVEEIADMMHKKYNYTISKNEKTYLLIYLYRLTK